MTRFISLALAATAAFATLGAQAASGEPPGLNSKQSFQPLAIGTAHKLQKTYIDTNAESGLPVGAGTFTTVGTQLNVNCSNGAGCTISATMNAQLAAGASENAAAICLVIDGSSVNCPFNALIRAGSGYSMMSYTTSAPISAGNHTVNMQIYSTQTSALYRWNKEIKLYKP